MKRDDIIQVRITKQEKKEIQKYSGKNKMSAFFRMLWYKFRSEHETNPF